MPFEKNEILKFKQFMKSEKMLISFTRILNVQLKKEMDAKLISNILQQQK